MDKDEELRSRRAWVLAGAALTVGAATVLLYLPALGNGFVNWDDPVYVYQQRHIDSLGSDFLLWAFSTFEHSNWHPLTWTSLALDRAVWGPEPFGFHLTNVLLHGFATALVVVLAARLFDRESRGPWSASLFGALCVGGLFAAHPLHVESVAWVSERKDVLYACFWLASLWAYHARADARSEKQRRLLYGLSMLAFSLALMSKPMAVTLPFVLLLVDYPVLQRSGFDRSLLRRSVLVTLPYFALSAASVVLTIAAQHSGGALESVDQLPFAERAQNALGAIGFYLARTVVPMDLSPYYPLPARSSLGSWVVVAGAGLLVAGTTAAFALRRRFPWLVGVWLYFLISLLPVLGLVQVGSQAAADRYMYLPILGPLLVVGAAAVHAWPRGPGARALVVTATLLGVGVFSVLTVRQIGVWKDAVTLWESVIARGARDAKAYYNLGNAYKDKGDFDRASEAWTRAVAAAPRHALALSQLGSVALLAGSLSEAKQHYLAALEADPNLPEGRYNLAVTLDRLGEHDAAARQFRRFLATALPEHAPYFPKVERRLRHGPASR